ncbi:N-acyl homoserine lactonase family protein [Herbiconiux ginsengi]|uniref:Glyoxylase, beta-lactamase superfamily II n=1 Tax=Herbiconiux ginsengi TaxID=381665 RepID=A0A1H3RLP9_9MICO|nr:N-acyl homoserine lactonase family protein [Herbiconiux ginsengi]SDZ26295.1 Glyoxylase, beta-lactamase superfamily II [Herbiconiux ginsengi]
MSNPQQPPSSSVSSPIRRPDSPSEFRVYAVRYATRSGLRGQHFHCLTSDWDAPHETAYFVWVAVSATRTVVVDAGIHPERAASVPEIAYRGSPPELLAALGVAPEQVDTLVLTHLHYDHTGTVALFPNARIVVQQAELEYWTGPLAARIVRERWLMEPADVAHVQAALAPTTDAHPGGAIAVIGDAELAPGFSVHLVGGHTVGMQVVRFATAAGPFVVASDAAHYYENIEDDRPFEILHDVPGMYLGFDRINELAGSPTRVAPGHDPEVFTRHPPLPGHPHVTRLA